MVDLMARPRPKAVESFDEENFAIMARSERFELPTLRFEV